MKRKYSAKAIKAATDTVQRLSRPGTANRFFTIIEVSKQTGVSTKEIVDELVRRPLSRDAALINRKPRAAQKDTPND